VQVAYRAGDPGDLVIVGEKRKRNDVAPFAGWFITALLAVKFAWQSRKERRAARGHEAKRF